MNIEKESSFDDLFRFLLTEKKYSCSILQSKSFSGFNTRSETTTLFEYLKFVIFIIYPGVTFCSLQGSYQQNKLIT